MLRCRRLSIRRRRRGALRHGPRGTASRRRVATNDVRPATGANVIKLFTAVIHEFLLKARTLVPGKPFQSSLMFGGKPSLLHKSVNYAS
jgi:hypothetical protein